MGLIAREIIIQQRLKTSPHILVGHLTGHKLAGIEAHTIVQEQFDVHGYKLAAELIYRALQFYLDLLQAVLKNLLFLLREMQSLIGAIREEGIVAHLTSQGRTLDQVGMEEQSHALRHLIRFHLDMRYLSRRKARHRTLLVIIFLTTISNVARQVLLQEEGIQAIIEREIRRMASAILQIDNCHQGILRLHAEELAVLIHRTEFDNFFHTSLCHLKNILCLQEHQAMPFTPMRHRFFPLQK